jgi:thymidylate synthase ThyX
MRATANLRGWLGLLRLRLPPNVQKEFRLYAEAVRSLLRPAFPRTLSLFDESFDSK